MVVMFMVIVVVLLLNSERDDPCDQRTGRIATSKDNLQTLQSQLRRPEYNNIEKRYGKLKLQVATMEMVNRDLEKYQSALEKALISFHSTKMEEINKTIKELWQEIYCNEDIDYIYIQVWR